MELKLKELRAQRGLTVRQLAESAGMSPSHYSEIENGKKKINERSMELISRALGIRPIQLISTGSRTERLVQDFQSLPDKDKELVLQFVQRMLPAEAK